MAVFTGWGWSCWTGVLDAARYGIPQHRHRAILLASLDHKVGPPPPTHGPVVHDLFGGTLAPLYRLDNGSHFFAEPRCDLHRELLGRPRHTSRCEIVGHMEVVS